MANTYLHPTAGYIVNMGYQGAPEPISVKGRDYLRALASEVAEIAARPEQAARREMWTDHNELRSKLPLFILYPEDGWADLIGPDELKMESALWRNCEWYLKHLIYRKRYIDDDFFTAAQIFPLVEHTIDNYGFGLPGKPLKLIEESGAWRNEPALMTYSDLHKMVPPKLRIDRDMTNRRMEAVQEVFRGVLAVTPHLSSRFEANQPGCAAGLRGIEQVMLDMYDEPDNLHALLEIITQGYIGLYRDMEASGYLLPNTDNHYVDAGGNGFSDTMPRSAPAPLSSLWAHGVAQEYFGVSPAMHAEFGVAYQARILRLFGRSAYGCCEPYTKKFGILKDVPNLRRVSVSAWCDIEEAAAALSDKIIFSWKPNPSVVLYGDTDTIRKSVRAALHCAKDCYLEIFLKDIIRLKGLADRIFQFSGILREEIGRACG